MFGRSTFVISSAALINLCTAGLQVPLLVINLSPYEAEVDMTLDENCIKHDYDRDSLDHYYDSWESSNLADFGEDYAEYDGHLQQYKAKLGVPKLRGHSAPMQGVTTIPAFKVNETNDASPYIVFETEMAGSGGCFGSHSRKSFAITVNGSTEQFTLEDPPESEWTITMDSPNNTQIVLGSGGHASWSQVLLDVATGVCAVITAGAAAGWVTLLSTAVRELGAEEVIKYATLGVINNSFWALTANGVLGVADYMEKARSEADLEPSGDNFTMPAVDTSTFYKDFGDVYHDLKDEDRSACVLGKNIIGNYDCLAAGTSLVIQGNGKVLAVPLPNIYRAWN